MFGSWIIRLVPWWLWAAGAALSGSLLVDVTRDHLALREEVAMARLAGPPPLSQLGDGTLPGAGRPLHEFRLIALPAASGHYTAGKRRMGFVLMVPEAGGEPLLALTMPERDLIGAEAQLLGAGAGRERVEVSGFLDPVAGDLPDLRRALAAQGLPARGVILVATAWFGSRDAALSAQMTDSMLLVGLIAALGMALAVTAWVRFRNWRRRILARRGDVQFHRPKAETPAAAGPWGNAAAPRPVAGRGAAPTARVAAKPVVASATALRGGDRALSASVPSRRDSFAGSPIRRRPDGLRGWFWW